MPRARFVINTLDFDQYMSYVQATGAEPYVVLNYDSANTILGPGDWSYTKLLALAKSWLNYIKSKGYKVRPCQPALYLCSCLLTYWRSPLLPVLLPLHCMFTFR